MSDTSNDTTSDFLDEGEVILVEFRSHKDVAVKLFIEPWCEEMELPQHVSLRLTAIDPNPATSMVTIEFRDDLVVVHGVPNAIMRLYRDGKQVWESFQAFMLPEQIDPNFGKPFGTLEE